MDLPFCKKRLCFRVFCFVKKKRWRFCGGTEWEEGGGRKEAEEVGWEGRRGGAATSGARSSDKSYSTLTITYWKIHTIWIIWGWHRMKWKTMFNMLLFKKSLLKWTFCLRLFLCLKGTLSSLFIQFLQVSHTSAESAYQQAGLPITPAFSRQDWQGLLPHSSRIPSEVYGSPICHELCKLWNKKKNRVKYLW